ncbi:MAG: 2-oxoglutarate dehydrogenase complex dihydrolipoyllysine-residue succinyltransferase [Desulfobacterales bacterium]
MQVELKVPEVGESVKEAILAEWYKKEGDYVKKDEPVFVIETDKVTLEVPADQSGVLHILVQEGETVEIGKVVGTLDTEGAEKAPEAGEKPKPETAEPKAAESEKPAAEAEKTEEKPPEPKPAEKAAPEEKETAEKAPEVEEKPAEAAQLMPSVRRLIREHDLDPAQIQGSGPGGRITKGDVLLYLESDEAKAKPAEKAPAEPEKEPAGKAPAGAEEVTRKRMSPIRKRIAEHLLNAKQNTAMLTTFNEIDMSRVAEVRSQFKDAFFKKYDTRLGFMSFFIKAVVAALKEFPEVNARIENEEIVYHHYYHIGIAIGAKRGLVVPVIRHADQKSFAELESEIIEFAGKVKENKLDLSELEGGTFSITNGGIYGSLLSTPILNMPQSAILGMHKIEDRPVAVNGEVAIRPMMYVALSYDHRIVDGKDAVTFLRRIKEFIENLERMMMEI